MDDNKINDDQNQPQSTSDQPQPVYETISMDKVEQDRADQSPNPSDEPEQIEPEEVSSDIASPEEAYNAQPTEAPSDIPSDVPTDIPTDIPPPIYEESKTKYFIIAGGVLFFFLIFFLFLKIFLGSKPKKQVALTYWGLYEEESVYAPLIADYEKKNPNVKITYQKMTPAEYREKLLARSPNGQGPDIFRYHNTWLPEIKDIVAPLPSTVMSNDTFEKTFYPIHAKDLKIDKYYYGIPLEIDGLVLIYNEDLLKKGGFTKPPSNLDELTQEHSYLEKLTNIDKDGNYISSAIALGTATNVEHFSDIFGLMLIQNGGDIRKLDQPEAVGALQSYRKFAETHIWDDSLPNSITAFAQEKVAMIIAPGWEIYTIHTLNPDLKLKTAPIPFNLPGTKPASLASYWVEGVNKYSKESLEAWKFLAFLSEKDNMVKMYEAEAKIRGYGEPYSRVDLADKIANDERIGVIVKQGDSYYSLPLVSRTNDNGLNDGVVKYIEDAINKTAAGVSYSEALSTANQGVNQVFSQYESK